MEIPHQPRQETPWDQMLGSLYSMRQSVANLREGVAPEKVAESLDMQLRYLIGNFGQHFSDVAWSPEQQQALDWYFGR